MGTKVHVPEHQWRKDQRKRKFKDNRRRKKDQYKSPREQRDHDNDHNDCDMREWQERWRD